MIQHSTKFIFNSIVLAFVLSIASGTSNLMAQIDQTLIGTWSGQVTQAGYPPYTTDMTINNLVIGQASGQTVYPTIPCTGSNNFLSNTDSLHVFSETLVSGPCISGRTEIYKLSPNTIQYNWYFTTGTVSQSSGILTRSTTGIDNPQPVQISEIYPNPFTQEAFLELEVITTDDIFIHLFNYLGKKIQTIHNGELSPGQKHIFQIDGSEMESGFYFVKIASSDFQTSKRILLFK